MKLRLSDSQPLRPRFLVLGGSGYLGQHLYRLLGPRNAVATFNSTPFPGGVHFDGRSMQLRDTLLAAPHGFKVAFVLYGVTRIDDCARDPSLTARVNVHSVIELLDQLVAAGIKPVYASSDAVFDGSKGGWTEDDSPNPILTYGRQKAAVERHLLGMQPPWIIARLSKLVGGRLDPHCLLGEWISSIEDERVIRCATDLAFTPLHVEDAADCLVRLGESALSGIYNVCGPRSMTRFVLLQTIAQTVRRHSNKQPKIVPCSIRDFPFLEPRPLDGSMSSAKLRSVPGVRLRDMESVCDEVAAQRYASDPTARPKETSSRK